MFLGSDKFNSIMRFHIKDKYTNMNEKSILVGDQVQTLIINKMPLDFAEESLH